MPSNRCQNRALYLWLCAYKVSERFRISHRHHIVSGPMETAGEGVWDVGGKSMFQACKTEMGCNTVMARLCVCMQWFARSFAPRVLSS